MQFSIYSKVLLPHVLHRSIFTFQDKSRKVCHLTAFCLLSLSLSPSRSLRPCLVAVKELHVNNFHVVSGICALFIEYCDYLYAICDSSKTNSSELNSIKRMQLVRFFALVLALSPEVQCLHIYLYTEDTITDNKEKFKLSTKPKNIQRKWVRERERWSERKEK